MEKYGIAIASVVIALIAAVIIGVAAISKSGDKTTPDDLNSLLERTDMSVEDANADIQTILKNVKVKTGNPSKAAVSFDDNAIVNLPDIDSKYPLTVTGKGDINIEIFSSTEKAGTDLDGWLNRMAEDFNNKKSKTSDGKTMSISVRKMPSGAAVDYITSGVYKPKAYTPSNILFGELVSAKGCKLEMITDTLVNNTAGIAIQKDAESRIKSEYGSVDLKTITQAAIDGKLSFGYVYPYTSATGLNYLVSALQSFDSSNMLSQTAVQSLQGLQSNIDFICYTTDQMTKAMLNGSLEAGVVEYQSYKNKATLQNYSFIPFGYEHSNPMYAVGDLTSGEMETIKAFTEYCLTDEAQKSATECGFNSYSYTSKNPTITGDKIYQAQQVWKNEKNASTPVAAVFIADCSGSMSENNAIGQLKEALLSASTNIASTNHIGLVSYSDNVTIELPLGEFNLDQRSYFAGAVNNLAANNSTATYNAVAVALNMLREYKETNPDIKPIIFVLSDGQSNTGASFKRLAPALKAVGVPVYTIAYNFDSSDSVELQTLSDVNEAAAIKADNSDVAYELSMLFNAQM